MPVPPGTEDTFGPWPGDSTSVGGDPGGGTGDPTTPAIIEAGIPYWHRAPEIWNTITIAGMKLPGRARVTGELRRKLDKKNAKGIDGLTITDDGEDEAPIEITIDIVSEDDWNRFQTIVPFISPKGAGKKSGVTVDYPTLALFGLNKVYVEAVSIPSFKQTQILTCVIKATDWRPGPKAAQTPKSSTPDTTVESHEGASRAAKAVGDSGGDDAYVQDNANSIDEFDVDSEP